LGRADGLSQLKGAKVSKEKTISLQLNRRELHLVRLWWLPCEDMQIENGTCNECEFKHECRIIREKFNNFRIRRGEKKQNKKWG